MTLFLLETVNLLSIIQFMQEQLSFYTQQIEVHSALLEQAKKKLRYFSTLRLLAFVILVLSCYFIGFQAVLLPVLIVEITVFIYLINKWLDAKIIKEKEELYIQLNQQEIKLLGGNWSSFENGEEFKSAQHPFANDMDLFGKKSVYQYVNRTVLPLGAKMLAQTLGEGAKNKVLNQQMIAELSQNIEWCQRFIVESKVYLKNEERQQSLDALHELTVDQARLLFLRWLLPVVSISSLVLYNLDVVSFGQLLLVIVAVLGVIGINLKHTNQLMHTLSNRSEKINALINQLEQLKTIQLQTKEGNELKAQLFDKTGVYEGLKALERIKKRSEYRMNTVVGVVLNFLFAWDFHLLAQTQKWKQQFNQSMAHVETDLAQVEVWISGAIYQFNSQQTCFATFSTNNDFKISALRHPFIPFEKQVANDFDLSNDESFFIITGPNMAGKSTYLRSVGWAIISANAGFPILANSCILPEMQLYSSMRTSDDLTVESSYFHAELTRLRFIMDAIEQKGNVFVILDEILKGTNSKDKEMGSAEFLKKLNRVGAKGIIATHDLSLTDLAKTTPAFRNVYFDSTITNDDLYFDYKMRNGVCQNMNASFLLKKMQLIDG